MEDRLGACCAHAETSRQTTVFSHRGIIYLFRHPLLGLGMAVLAIALVSAPASCSTERGDAQFFAKNDAAMTRMMAAMMKIKPSNDVDRDFVALMVPHHQSAIDMAAAELSYGHNGPLYRLAQEIMVTQPQDIALMRLALVSAPASWSTGPGDTQFFTKNDAAMTKMMAAMMKIKPSNDVDRDFVALMVPHHQGAIDMAAAELSYGHNEPLRGLAQEIIATQQQEIVAMRRALGEPLLASVPSSNQPSLTRMYRLSYHFRPLRETSAEGALT